MTIQQLFKTAPVTTLLLVSFIGLFVIQVLTGVDANNPSTENLLNWGANALPYTMNEDPWRLVSSAFLHIGLMHLLFNAFAMYFFGQVAEPIFGSAKFLVLFLLAAVGGGLLNNYITWQALLEGTGQPGLSAGASGGIMGIGAALLIVALFKISVNGMVLNLKSLIMIMGINLVYGFAVPGIDNAGHIGGAITGLVIALPFAIAYRQRMTVTLQNAAIDQNQYRHSYQTDYQSNDLSIDLTNDQNIYSSTNIDQISDPNSETETSRISKRNPVQPSPIWQLLPWLVMLLVSIGFIWWWQDIHAQIMQILKTIE